METSNNNFSDEINEDSEDEYSEEDLYSEYEKDLDNLNSEDSDDSDEYYDDDLNNSKSYFQAPNICFVGETKNLLYKIKNFKLTKSKFISILTFIIGLFFILFGLSVFLFRASAKVVDNVAFSEASVFSAFLIIIGIFIITFALFSSIIKKTPLEGIYSEVQYVEKNMDKNLGDDEFVFDGTDHEPYDLDNEDFEYDDEFVSDGVDQESHDSDEENSSKY